MTQTTRRTTKITKPAKAVTKKTVTILVRYFIKKDTVINGELVPAKSVVCRVRNGQGREYTVVLRRSKAHSCSCDAFVKGHGKYECYHIDVCRNVENTRAEQCKRQHCATCATPCSVVAPCLVEDKPAVTEPAQIAAPATQIIAGSGGSIAAIMHSDERRSTPSKIDTSTLGYSKAFSSLR